jgi:hypothetical protein
MKNHLTAMKLKYERRLQAYQESGDKANAREAERVLWALNGVLELKLLVNPVRELLQRFKRLDLVPTHYKYPEFYRI